MDVLHRSILVVDMEGWSRPARTNSIRGRLREELYLLLEEAVASLGVAAAKAEPPRDQGDGALLLFRPEVPKNRLLHPMVTSLASGLAAYNAAAPERERMRLRVALHAGELLSDDHGPFGEDLDHAFGLVNSDTLRSCLAHTTSPLALLVSDRIYQGVVKHSLPGIDATAYGPVHALVKQTTVPAWLHIPHPEPLRPVAPLIAEVA